MENTKILKLTTNQFQIRGILGEATMKLKNISNSEVSDEAMLKRLAFWLNHQQPQKSAKIVTKHRKNHISSNSKRTEGSAQASQSRPTNFPWIKSKAEQRQRYVRIKR